MQRFAARLGVVTGKHLAEVCYTGYRNKGKSRKTWSLHAQYILLLICKNKNDKWNKVLTKT